MSEVFDEIMELFSQNNAREYLGEDVTLVEHMLQSGSLAIEDGAEPEMIVAALLHDIGHLLIPDAEQMQELEIDAHHDEIGFEWISQRFPTEVAMPVKLHVDAKRYLVTTNPEYETKLSTASILTMRLQGGVMSDEELDEFESNEFYEDGIQIRLWDDESKDRNNSHLPLLAFEEYINLCAL